LIHDLAVPSDALISSITLEKSSGFAREQRGHRNCKTLASTPIEWEQTVGVNITAPFMLMQHLPPCRPAPAWSIFFPSQLNWAPTGERLLHEAFALELRNACAKNCATADRMITVYPAATDTNTGTLRAVATKNDHTRGRRAVAHAFPANGRSAGEYHTLESTEICDPLGNLGVNNAAQLRLCGVFREVSRQD
jgi:hypothetical protein